MFKHKLRVLGCLLTSACLTSFSLTPYIHCHLIFLFGGLLVEPIPYASLCLIFIFINTLHSQEHKRYSNK